MSCCQRYPPSPNLDMTVGYDNIDCRINRMQAAYQKRRLALVQVFAKLHPAMNDQRSLFEMILPVPLGQTNSATALILQTLTWAYRKTDVLACASNEI